MLLVCLINAHTYTHAKFVTAYREFSHKHNRKLFEIYRELDVIGVIKANRIRWRGKG